MALIRFKDGQMISPDRITGLIKFDRYPDNIPVVQILGMDGHVTFECGSPAEQDELLHTLGKQLERYLNPVDLIDLDLNMGNKIN
jgi:hypothetical protein